MRRFTWKRQDRGPRYGVLWTLVEGAETIARCFYLSGSKRWQCSAHVPAIGGVVLRDYHAGTPAAARRQLETEFDRRSIGWFGDDTVTFERGQS